MRRYIMMTLLAATIFVGPVFGAQVSIGIRIGPPPRPRVVRVLPAQPGPEYLWVEGYWYPAGNHWKWHTGYWTRAPYGGALWWSPRYESGEYFEGYWEGEHGRMNHNHGWDKHRERDYWDHDRDQDHDRDHGRGHR